MAEKGINCAIFKIDPRVSMLADNEKGYVSQSLGGKACLPENYVSKI